MTPSKDTAGAQVFDPAQSASTIAMTPAAQAHVRRQLAKEGAQALVLGVKTSGCNGYMYDLSFLESPSGPEPADARAFDFDGVKVFVGNADWPLVRGTEIDYVVAGLNAALTFRNPNAASECGCGESFSIAAENASA